jgi:hypothetical protein
MHFFDAHAFIAIGFVRHIFAGFAHPAQKTAVLFESFALPLLSWFAAI